MSSENSEASNVWNKATLVLSGRNKKNKKKSKSLPSGSTPPAGFARDLRSKSFQQASDYRAGTLNNLQKLPNGHESERHGDAASTSTGTTASNTTIGPRAFVGSLTNHPPDYSFPILSKKQSPASPLAKDERAAVARRRGLCENCGVRTHKITTFKRIPLNNNFVANGNCLRCNTDQLGQTENSPDFGVRSGSLSPVSPGSTRSPSSVRFQGSPRSPSARGRTLQRTRSTPAALQDGSYRRGIQRHSSEGNFASQNSRHLTKIMEHLSSGDYVSFASRLESMEASEVAAINAGLKHFRKKVSSAQLASPTTNVLSDESWLTAIMSKIEDGSDEELLVQCLSTFLTFSSLPGSYRKSMVKRGAVKAACSVLDSMHQFPRAREVACAFLFSMKAHEPKFQPNEETVRKLVDIAASNEGKYVREYALMTLYHTSKGFKPVHSKDNRAKILREAVTKPSFIKPTIELLLSNAVHERSIEAAFHLWRMYSVPDGKDSPIVVPSDGLIQCILCLLSQKARTVAVLELGCVIVGNLAMHPLFPDAMTADVAGGIHDLLSKEQGGKVPAGLVISGLHALCNLLASPTRRKASEFEGRLAGLLVSCLAQNPDEPVILSLSSEVMTFICASELFAVDLFVSQGGLDHLSSGLRRYLLSADPLSDVVGNALRALEQVTRTERGARRALDLHFLASIGPEMKRLSFPSAHAKIASIVRNLLLVPILLEALQDSPRAAGCPKPPELLVPLAPEAVVDVIQVMGRYSDLLLVQEVGCEVLAESFMLQAKQSAGPGGECEKILMPASTIQRAIVSLQLLMRRYRGEARVSSCACCAISNLLACRIESESREWVPSLNPLLGEVLDIVSGCDHEAWTNGLVLLWRISDRCDRGFLGIFAPRIILQLFDSILKSGGDSVLRGVLLDFLWASTNETEYMACAGSGPGVMVLLLVLECDDKVNGAKSSELLAWLLNSGHLPSGSMLTLLRSSKRLTQCMAKHRSCPRIQSALCSVLGSLLEHGEYEFPFLGGDCCLVVSEALVVHSEETDVVASGCRALELAVLSMEDAALGELPLSLFCKLWQIVERELDNERVCVAVFGVLSAMCSRNNLVRRLVESPRCVPCVVRTMKCHLGSLPLQKGGCCVISGLADFSDNLKEDIVDCGGLEAVINCLLAHVYDPALQRKALSALRKVAECRSSTHLLKDLAAENAVFVALLYHLREPRVVSDAFFALSSVLTDLKTGEVFELKPGNFVRIIEAMRRYPADGAVQESGCALLKVCASNSSNLKAMGKHLRDLVSVVCEASHCFPRHCEEPASTLLAALSTGFPALEKDASGVLRQIPLESVPACQSRVLPFDGGEDGPIFAAQRDAIVSVRGPDGIVRDEPIYLRRKNTSDSSHVAYQRPSPSARLGPCFRAQRLRGFRDGFVVVCSVLCKPLGDDHYEHFKDGEYRRGLVLINKYEITRSSPSKIASACRIFQEKLQGTVPCKDILQDESSLYVVYEVPGLETHGYRTLGDKVLPVNLESINRFRAHPFDEKEIQSVFLQIVSQVKNLHRAGFWHGRICPESILHMGKHGVFLCDVIGPLFSLPVPLAGAGQATMSYIAPESLGSNDFDRFGADVWNLGATLFALLTNSELCHEHNDRNYRLFVVSGGLQDDSVIDGAMKVVLSEDSSESRNALWLSWLGIKRLSTGARELLALMLQPNPDTRISLDGILQHRWVTGSVGGSNGSDNADPDLPGPSSCRAPGGLRSLTSKTSHGGGHKGGKPGSSGCGRPRSQPRGQRQRQRQQKGGRQNSSEKSRKPRRQKDNGSDSEDEGSGRPSERTHEGNGTGEKLCDCITLVQSSPLACNNDGQLVPMGRLNIHEERRVLAEAFAEANAPIKIVFDIATTERLGAILSGRKTRVLHFSGHGCPEYLAIEDGVGGMEPLLIHDLMDLISMGGPSQRLEFVFVSACCSRSVGEAFLEAGVPHVVCCDQDNLQIRDDAAVAFQKSLYRSMASGNTVQAAFDQARKAIQYSSMLSKPQLEAEMAKFCLLPEGGGHNVQIFFTRGSDATANENPSELPQARLPPPPSPFVGREVETYTLNCALQRARLVRISGDKGIGKKSLAKFHGRFVDDRRHIQNFEDVMWFPSIVGNRNTSMNQLFENLYDCSQSDEENDDSINKIIQHLYGRRVLIILESNGTRAMHRFLYRLFTHNESVKVILIHSDDDGYAKRRMPCAEYNIRVPHLDIESNLILFCNMCPLVSNPRSLKDKLLQAYNDKRLWRSDIERMIGSGTPSQILGASKDITETELQRLVEIGERRSLDISFSTRADIIQKQQDVERAKSEAIRQENFELAGNLQFHLDEMERLKLEFPDVETMERRKAEMKHYLRRLIDQELYGPAQRLRLDIDRLEERIRVEQAAMEKLQSSREEDYTEFSIEKLDRCLDEMNRRLRLALDDNDFVSAMETYEQMKKFEKQKLNLEEKAKHANDPFRAGGETQPARIKEDIQTLPKLSTKKTQKQSPEDWPVPCSQAEIF